MATINLPHAGRRWLLLMHPPRGEDGYFSEMKNAASA